jgi:plasmid replication initiation protein
MNESGDTILQQAQWLSGVQYHVNSGTVTIAINPFIEPLFRKYKQYTETEFAFLCKFSCQYSERLYELLKSLAWDKKPTVDFSTEDLRERLGMKMVRGEKEVNKYPNYNDFERFVIIPSKEDINKYTDLDIDYRVHRGLYNKVDKVIFSVRKKDNYVPLAERIANGEFDTLPELEGQITLFDDDEFDCEEE